MIHAFAGTRFGARAGELSHLVTPPYDKIGPEDLVRLRAKSPYSPVRLMRGESGPEDQTWYPESARLFAEWRRNGVLADDPREAFYVLRQEFTDPAGVRRTRTAVLGVLDLDARGRVFPHEKTHARAREDRYRLLKATDVHYELIFLLRASGKPLPAELLAGRGLGGVDGLEGAKHSLSMVDDPAKVTELARELADGPYVIADGHHRFATACRYADENRKARFVLVGVVDVHDPGLVILPTHRLLQGVGKEKVSALLARIPKTRPLKTNRPWEEVATAGPGTIALIGPNGAPALLFQHGTTSASPAEELDVLILEREILRPLLQGKETEDHLSYHRDPVRPYTDLLEGRADFLGLLPPIPASKVTEIALRREIMPQKSTDFYPKLPTGFVFFPLDGRVQGAC